MRIRSTVLVAAISCVLVAGAGPRLHETALAESLGEDSTERTSGITLDVLAQRPCTLDEQQTDRRATLFDQIVRVRLSNTGPSDVLVVSSSGDTMMPVLLLRARTNADDPWRLVNPPLPPVANLQTIFQPPRYKLLSLPPKSAVEFEGAFLGEDGTDYVVSVLVKRRSGRSLSEVRSRTLRPVAS